TVVCSTDRDLSAVSANVLPAQGIVEDLADWRFSQQVCYRRSSTKRRAVGLVVVFGLASRIVIVFEINSDRVQCSVNACLRNQIPEYGIAVRAKLLVPTDFF